MSILYKKSVRGPARVSVGLLRSGALAVETHEDWLEANPPHQHETIQGAQTRADKGSRLTAAGHGWHCDTWGLRANHARSPARQHGQSNLQKSLDITLLQFLNTTGAFWRPPRAMGAERSRLPGYAMRARRGDT